MKPDDIEDLLTRYYEGVTSEAEEKELKRFFMEEEVSEDLLAEKELFLQLAACPERLNDMIDAWDMSEKRALKVKKRTRIIRLQWLGRIAASLLLLFSVGMYLYKPSAPKDTCATPEEAYMQAQKALVMLSSRLNKGMEEVETVQEATGKIRENVYEQLNRINNTKQ